MMVLAGPGSGKTTVITHRTKQLVMEHHIEPSNILVISFTKASAKEMQNRFYQLIGSKDVPVTFGTFHAVYFFILRLAYGYKSSDIIREDLRYHLMKEYINREKLETDDENDFIRSLLVEISLVKSNQIPIDSYYSTTCAQQSFRKIFQSYNDYLRQNRKLDFDDMLIYCKELFIHRKDILSAWQKKYQYILIDEFQDINPIQYDVIKMLAAPHNNLFIVGDDDQSIYHFRGATPAILKTFKNDFPNTKIVTLNANYRSGKNIIRTSTNLIRFNQMRFDKSIYAGNDKTDICIYQDFYTQREQYQRIIELIEEEKSKGRPYRDISVLFRTNHNAMYLLEMMSYSNIPFSSKDKIPNLYNHWIAEDIFSYIRIAIGDGSRADFLRIMNRPNRYISRDAIGSGGYDFEDIYMHYKKVPWMLERIRKLSVDLTMIKSMKPYPAINYICKGIGYADYLREYASERNMLEEELLEILENLVDHAKQYSSFHEWFDAIEAFTNELQKNQSNHEDAVMISTYHGSKGLEYDTVFLPDLCEGITPYKKAVLDEDIEEERRMFYVAITRAKRQLYMFWPKKIGSGDRIQSRFINESKTGVKTK